jgi:hypothetical protein
MTVAITITRTFAGAIVIAMTITLVSTLTISVGVNSDRDCKRDHCQYTTKDNTTLQQMHITTSYVLVKDNHKLSLPSTARHSSYTLNANIKNTVIDMTMQSIAAFRAVRTRSDQLRT